MSRRIVRDAVAAVVMTTAVAGCSGSPSAPAPGPTGATDRQAAASLDADWSLLGGEGFVYLQVNTDGEKHYELVRVDAGTGEVDQVTDVPGPFGISMFSVGEAGLVVAEASQLVDHLASVEEDGRLVRLRPSRGSSPMLNERGDVIAFRPTPDGSADMIVLRPRGSHRWRRLTRPRSDWTTARWLDDDTVLQLRPGRRTTWWTVDVDGRASKERFLVRRAYVPEPSASRPGQPVVLSSPGPAPPLLWRPGRRPTALPPGWSSACLSPDGERLLLLGTGRLGLLATDDLDGPARVIGTTRTDVLSCGWVEQELGR